MVGVEVTQILSDLEIPRLTEPEGGSCGLFWPGSGLGARNTQNEPPVAYSGQVLGLGPEMLKMSILWPILARFWA